MKYWIGLHAWMLLALLSISGRANAQSRPSGSYANAEDWLNGHPIKEFEPSIRKIVHDMGGFDLFKFNNENGNQIGAGNWGLVKNDTLYVWYKGATFIKALEQGRICYFNGPPYVSQGQRIAINSNYFWFGSIIGTITAVDVAAQVKDRIHYVLDTRTGRLYPLGVGRMRIFLSDYPALLASFEREPQPPPVPVMLDYLRKLNAVSGVD